jgi:hypothetical protein
MASPVAFTFLTRKQTVLLVLIFEDFISSCARQASQQTSLITVTQLT